jgi:hypothetical protein
MNFLACAMFLAAAPADKLDLKLGDEWTCRIEQSFLYPDSTNPKEDEMLYVFEQRAKITGKKTDEYDLATATRLALHRSGPDVIPLDPSTADLAETVAIGRDGLRRFVRSRYAIAGEFRLSRLGWFVFPSSAGAEAWTAKFPTPAPDWAPAAEADYRKAGRTFRLNRACTLYRVSFREKGGDMRASGAIEVDEATGLPLYVKMAAENAPMPGGELKYKLTFIASVSNLKLKPRP